MTMRRLRLSGVLYFIHASSCFKHITIIDIVNNSFLFTIIMSSEHVLLNKLILYLIETPFNAFANREDPDQAALVRAA